MDPAEACGKMVAAKSYQPCAVSGSLPGRAPGICETLPECSRYRQLCKTPGVGTLRGCGRFVWERIPDPWAGDFINDAGR